MQLILDPHLYEDLFKFKVTPVFFIRGVPLDDEDKTELHLEEVWTSYGGSLNLSKMESESHMDEDWTWLGRKLNLK